MNAEIVQFIHVMNCQEAADDCDVAPGKRPTSGALEFFKKINAFNLGHYDICNQDVCARVVDRAGAVRAVEELEFCWVCKCSDFVTFAFEGCFQQGADALIIVKNQNL